MSHSIRKNIFLRNNPRTTLKIRKMRFEEFKALESNEKVFIESHTAEIMKNQFEVHCYA